MASNWNHTLPLLPLTSGVVLPGMVVTMALETPEAKAAAEAARSADGRIVLVPRVDGRYAGLGVVSVIEEAGSLPNGIEAIVVRGERRAHIGAGVPGTSSALWVQVEPVDEPPASERAHELAREYRAVIENILESRGARAIIAGLRQITEPSALADTAGYSPDLDFAKKVELLETVDVEARLDLALEWARESLADLTLKERIRSDVEQGM